MVQSSYSDVSSTKRTILSVSELNAEVSLLLQQVFPLVWIEGEISNLSQPASGHLYFSLKDKKAQIRCALFKNRRLRIRLKPKNGIKVVARAKIALYEARGDYQLLIEHIEEAGKGDLQQAFEALRKKLEAQGLFAEKHKRALPIFPKQIGLITSTSGAAVQDILQVLSRRAPFIPVCIYPVSVQGDKAPLEIETAIRGANQEKRCDVLIIARGGGSLEDLWAFNHEHVVQAISDCTIPVVTGIGHEIDFSLADYVADKRAPTPSAAAEMVSPDGQELLLKLESLERRLRRYMSQSLLAFRDKLQWLETRLQQQAPERRLLQQMQRLDELEQRLYQAMERRIERDQLRFLRLQHRLQEQHPEHFVQAQQNKLEQLRQRLVYRMQQQLRECEYRLGKRVGRLEGLSPLGTLQRGYAIVEETGESKLVRSVRDIYVGQSLEVRLSDGVLRCEVKNIN